MGLPDLGWIVRPALALLAALALVAGAQTLRLGGAKARLEAAETRLERCVADLAAAGALRITEEKAREGYEENRGLAAPDAARGRLRDGSFFVGSGLAP